MRATTTLGQLAEDGALYFSDGYRTRQAELGDDGFPILRVAQVADGFLQVDGSEECVRKEFSSKIGPKLTRAGDVVLSTKGTVGRRAIVPSAFPSYVYSPQVCFFRVLDDAKIDSHYLYYWLGSPQFAEQSAGLKAQTDMADYISLRDLAHVKITLPSIAEQRSVGHALGSFDEKIAIGRRVDQIIEQMAQALFASWFVEYNPTRAKAKGKKPWGVDDRVAALFPDRFEKSEFGEIPEGWKVGTIADLSTLNPEAWTRESMPGTIEYVDLSNTKWGRIDSTSIYQAVDAPSRAQRVLRPGDTIIGTVRPENGSYTLVTREGLTASTGFAVLRPLEPEFREAVYLCVTGKENLQRLSHLADGGAYPAIHGSVVSATPLTLAPFSILREFSRMVGPLLVLAANGRSEERTLSNLRESLLPGLISGGLDMRRIYGHREKEAQ